MTIAWRRTLFLVFLIAIWELGYRVFDWGWKFPSPLQTAEAFVDGFANGHLFGSILASMRRLLISFVISILLGTGLGFLFARFRFLDETFGFLVVALQTVPSIAWLPFAIIWFGLNDTSVIFITAIGATWTMSMASRTGIAQISKIHLRAARMMGTGNGLKLFYQVMLPAAFPHLITGVRVAWAFAWRALTAGELIGRGLGLGQTLQDSRDIGDTATLLCVVIIIALIGTISDHFCFKRLEDGIMVRFGLHAAKN
ncbi:MULTISPECIES: ABC transporter permease [Paenibacillus]|uniref:Sulfate ABC transporter permease n=1 Tax=Paenibacillus glycanilyticus TaxID=126569 RepID=A0ABQ6NRV6_9BACL|nr:MULTISPECIES: ABC transporter permease [Paenibacillus]MCK9860258.1 ABC transporter permease [Paenibacillus sp. ATY16]GMK47847.1 sulfate ABC transporter permease [Paenibacillus glycanilyticus]